MLIILTILSLLAHVSTLVSAQQSVSSAAISSILNNSSTAPSTTVSFSNGSSVSLPTTVPLLHIIESPSNKTYVPRTYIGRIAAVSGDSTVYAISCLMSGNFSICGDIPITVTQGPSTFVRVDLMAPSTTVNKPTGLPASNTSVTGYNLPNRAVTLLATASSTYNRYKVARSVDMPQVTSKATVPAPTLTPSTSLGCSLSPNSAVCVNRMVLPLDSPAVAPFNTTAGGANADNTTIIVAAMVYLKNQIAWDVLLVTQGPDPTAGVFTASGNISNTLGATAKPGTFTASNAKGSPSMAAGLLLDQSQSKMALIIAAVATLALYL